MVENGFYSSFVYWRLIWACLVSNSWPRVKMATHGFQQILKGAEFFHKPLRLSLACLERQGMQQG
jgi:hypothetical protein